MSESKIDQHPMKLGLAKQLVADLELRRLEGLLAIYSRVACTPAYDPVVVTNTKRFIAWLTELKGSK